MERCPFNDFKTCLGESCAAYLMVGDNLNLCARCFNLNISLSLSELQNIEIDNVIDPFDYN